MTAGTDLLWCMERVAEQGDGGEWLAGMCEALALARTWPPRQSLSLEMLLDAARPIRGHGELRDVRVRVGWSVKMPPEQVERAMRDWLEAVNDDRLTARDAYVEFETIHPLRDGNGRLGAILYAYLLGWPEPLPNPPVVDWARV